jgi:electron transfer flavoprotein alpha subunit
MAMRCASRLASSAARIQRAQSSRLFSSRVLVLADHDNTKLGQSTRNVITAGCQLGDVAVLVSGNGSDSVASEAAGVSGVKEVFQMDKASLEHHIGENVGEAILALHKEQPFDYIIASTSSVGKGVLPRVACGLDVAPISDVIQIHDGKTFSRPIYAGNAIAKVESTDNVKVMTVRPTSFEAAADGGSASISKKDGTFAESAVQWVKDELSKSDRPDLGSAKVVISGGRGMQNQENFGMLEKLADKLGGAVGASRAAVDAGYAPNDQQVGQTGKVVAPELYMAFGISGAIQHLAGMKDSKTIVAVNKDEEAAIFQVADYGIVGDLFKVVPELQEKI